MLALSRDSALFMDFCTTRKLEKISTLLSSAGHICTMINIQNEAVPIGAHRFIHILYYISRSRSRTLLRKEKKMLTAENTFKEYPDIVSTKQMMKMLHIGRNKAFQLLNGDIPSIRIGRLHKIPKVFIIEYLNKQSLGN